MAAAPGAPVWYPAPDTRLLLPGRVVAAGAATTEVKTAAGDVVSVKSEIVRPMHASSVDGVDNMITLGDLHVGSILHNLARRFADDQIYTYTGSILVAINPFKQLKLYNSEYVTKYQGVRLGELPPHIFAVADEAYFRLLRDKGNQCVVISGESGAGKTESTKLILNYLAHLSGKHSQIEEQLLESSPILEAFGNAKTVRNNNSSRFGKFMEIQFAKAGHIEGARINDYLLEKSRIVAQAESERNYHIFYNMLAGASAEERKLLRLKAAKDFRVLSQSGCLVVNGMSDEEDFERVRSAMENLRMSDELISGIMRVVAAVLHLGNIEFTAVSDDTCKVNEKNGALDDAAFCLGVPPKTLAHSLVHRISQTSRETITAALSREKANDSRDALAKAVYGALFSHIVTTLNRVICSPSPSGHFIGVLDIFGFEDFKVNSFEQLCINYANEKLQQFFNHHIFKLEQEEYDKEGINWSKIDFVDNQPCLDLIAKRPVGVLLLLDEECTFPKATDLTLLDKLHANHAGKSAHPHYVKPKVAKSAFGIVHYAGAVTYDVTNFLEKNRDKLREDLENLMLSSSHMLVANVFKSATKEPQVLSPPQSPRHATSASSASTSSNSSAGSVASVSKAPTAQTVGSRFHESLTLLVATLSACNPFFVRCIKPNTLQKPSLLDADLVEAQLRYSGLLETVRIRKAGYAVRMPFDAFLRRYRFNMLGTPLMALTAMMDNKGKCAKILEAVGPDEKDNWQVGHAKAFMRDSVEVKLEKTRYGVFGVAARTVQRWVRRFLAQRAYRKARRAIILLQSVARGLRVRRKFAKQRRAAVLVQKVYRGHRLRIKYRLYREQALALQTAVRTRLALEAVVALSVQAQREAELLRQRKEDEEGRERQKEVLVAKRNELLRRQSAIEPLAALAGEAGAVEFSPRSGRRVVIDEAKKKALDAEIDAQLQAIASDPVLAMRASFDETSDILADIEQQLAQLEVQQPADDDAALADDDDSAAGGSDGMRRSDTRFSLTETTVAFARYARKHFRRGLDHRYALFPLASPLLLATAESVEEDAITISTLLMAFMGDHVLPVPLAPAAIVRQLVALCLHEAALRDEFLCQLMKQLLHNPNTPSRERGCQLLMLALLCFGPSNAVLDVFTSFLASSVEEPYSTMAAELMKAQLTLTVARELPTSQVEYDLVKSGERTVRVRVRAAGSSAWVQAPLLATVAEVARMAQQELQLESAAGLGLQLVMPNGDGRRASSKQRLLDAIARAENEGYLFIEPTMEAVLVKEGFGAQESLESSPKLAELCFAQAAAALRAWPLPTIEVSGQSSVAIVTAQHPRDAPLQTRALLERCLPAKLAARAALPEWEARIKKLLADWSELSPLQVKLKAIEGAQRLPTMFSERFAAKCTPETAPKIFPTATGTRHPVSAELPRVDLCVDRVGIHVMDDAGKTILLTTEYAKVQRFDATKDTFDFVTDEGDYHFKTEQAAHVKAAVAATVQILIAIGTQAIAKDAHDGSTDVLGFDKDDVIEILERNEETGWWRGTCHDQTGWFPAELVEVAVLGVRRPDVGRRRVSQLPSTPLEAQEAAPKDTLAQKYSMLNYARSYFRDAPSVRGKEGNRSRIMGTWSRNQSTRVSPDTADWGWRDLVRLIKFSKTPIKQSLVKLYADEDAAMAVEMFKVVMQFMGDASTSRAPAELGQWIILRGLERHLLRDELYCQIIKQTTSNTSRKGESVRMGWKLLELCLSCFPCSSTFDPYLRKHLQFYGLQKEHDFHKAALRCEEKLNMVKRFGVRLCVPTADEINTVLNGTLFVKITFPDTSQKSLEIWSCTSSNDVITSICKRLDVKNPEHYALFSEYRGDVTMLLNTSYVMDRVAQLRQAHEAAAKVLKKGEPELGRFEYRILFRKNVWLKNEISETSPGQLVHIAYHQSLAHLDKGEYRCSIDDAAEIAALQLRISEGTDQSTLKRKANNPLTKAAKEPVYKPHVFAHMWALQPPAEWVQMIDISLRSHMETDVHQWKVSLLKRMQTWDVFGSIFYLLQKPKSDRSNLPAHVILAVNVDGIKLISAEARTVIAAFPYAELSSWNYSPDMVTIKVGGMVQRAQRIVKGATGKGQEICYVISAYVKTAVAQAEAAAVAGGERPARGRSTTIMSR